MAALHKKQKLEEEKMRTNDERSTPMTYRQIGTDPLARARW